MLKLGEKSIKSLYYGSKAIIKAYLGSKCVFSASKPKPYYCEVEYLETTGTQYINTGVPFHFSEDTVILNAELTALSQYQTVYGVNESIDGATQFFGVRQLATQEKWQGLGVSISYPAFTLNKQFTLQISRIDKTFFQYKNEEVYTGVTGNLKDTTLNGFIFATNNNGNPAFNCIGKIHSFQQKRAGILICDLIPVLDWDMRPCMYDKVSGELFYNQGTGEFLYGREIHQVEYLESTGTQYIDTGYSLNTNTDELSIDYTNTSEQNYKWMFGEYESGKLFGITSQNVEEPRFAYRGLITATKEEQYYTKHTLIANSDGLFNDGIQKSSFVSFEGSWNIYLFALNNTGTSVNGYFGYGKIYGYIHKRNGSLIRDYIPAVDENGVGFMFDRVTHTIFDNAGTGDFSYPPVELEYLESSGTQYIDTGIIGRSGTLANIDFEWLDGNIGNDKYIIGSASASVRIYFGTYQGKWQYGYFGYLQADGIQANTKYNAEISWLLGNGYLNINNERIITSGMTDSRTSDLTLYLFARHQGNSISSWGAIAKIYSCKIYQDDVFVRDLIPCFKDGQVGMWDKINNILHTNAGTGSFITGKIIEKE